MRRRARLRCSSRVSLAGAVRFLDAGVDQRSCEAPDEIGDEYHDGRGEDRAHDARDECVLRRDIPDLDTPHMSEPEQRANDEDAAQPAFEAYDREARNSDFRFFMPRRPQQMADSPIRQHDRGGQCNENDGGPERRPRARDPQQPKQREIKAEPDRPCAAALLLLRGFDRFPTCGSRCTPDGLDPEAKQNETEHVGEELGSASFENPNCARTITVTQPKANQPTIRASRLDQ